MFAFSDIFLASSNGEKPKCHYTVINKYKCFLFYFQFYLFVNIVRHILCKILRLRSEMRYCGLGGEKGGICSKIWLKNPYKFCEMELEAFQKVKIFTDIFCVQSPFFDLVGFMQIYI